jgi:hypothetical protein
MHHSVKVTLILEIRFVKPDEQQIVEVAGFFLKFGDNRDFQRFPPDLRHLPG